MLHTEGQRGDNNRGKHPYPPNITAKTVYKSCHILLIEVVRNYVTETKNRKSVLERNGFWFSSLF